MNVLLHYIYVDFKWKFLKIIIYPTKMCIKSASCFNFRNANRALKLNTTLKFYAILCFCADVAYYIRPKLHH